MSYNLANHFQPRWTYTTNQTSGVLRIARFAMLKSYSAAKSDCRRRYSPPLPNRGIFAHSRFDQPFREEYEAAKVASATGNVVRGRLHSRLPTGQGCGQIVGLLLDGQGAIPDGIIDNHETIWPRTEGAKGSNKPSMPCLTGKTW
jgi:hypothetical protein